MKKNIIGEHAIKLKRPDELHLDLKTILTQKVLLRMYRVMIKMLKKHFAVKNIFTYF